MGMVRVVLVSVFLAMAVGLAKSVEFAEKDLVSDESLWDLYERWRSHHTVSRDLTEKQRRFNVFKANVQHVHKVNQMDKPYKLKLNKFADMTNLEFRNSYSSKIKHRRMLRGNRALTGFMHDKAANVPASVDWRKQGAVTGVKNQGNCGKFLEFQDFSFLVFGLNKYILIAGSCWAFSTVVGVEGINKIKTGSLVSLSEQELVDCEKDNEGCNGGLMENAYEFIKKEGGLTAENTYPYSAKDGTCDSAKVETETINQMQ